MIHSALGEHAHHDTLFARKRRRRNQLTLAVAAAGLVIAAGAVQQTLDRPPASQSSPAAYAYFSN